MQERRITKYILQDLDRRKIVAVSGPRQAGKTTLTENLLIPSASRHYYNWDIDAHRALIRNTVLDESKEYWIFDEIHKFTRWKNWLKGVYDLHKHNHKIIVTGSARLDLYSRGGDSLQGRYYNYRLHPFTLSEVLSLPEYNYRSFTNVAPVDLVALICDENLVKNTLQQLLTISCFPEPFLSDSKQFAARWRLAYAKRLVQEEVRSLESTEQLDLMEALFERIPDLIGNNFSLNKLAKDLELSQQTVSKWVTIFEKLYACIRILPYDPIQAKTKIRAVKKERKIYLWDCAAVPEPGAALENLIALHLVRLVHWFEDIYGETIELRYFRDVDGHEVDFLLLKNKQPWVAIEVKSSAQELNSGLRYFLERVHVPYAFQIHLNGDTDTRIKDINKCRVRLMPVHKFLCLLP